VDAVTERGGDVTSAREYRPSFDEVFAALLSGTDPSVDVANGSAGTQEAA
jgi:hypothetical protein